MLERNIFWIPKQELPYALDELHLNGWYINLIDDFVHPFLSKVLAERIWV